VPDGSPAASLVVQTSFLGDVVLTTALLRELAGRGPVDVVVRPDAAAVLAGHPDVRRVVVYDKRGRDRGVGGVWRLARALRAAGPYAAAYLAQGSPRSAALALAAGCRVRVGFDTSRNARPLYTRVVRFRRDRHHAERLWALACPDAEPSAEAARPRLYPGEAERAAVDALLGGLAAGAGGFVAVAPGSVWATKRWPFYPALGAELAGGWPVVVTGGPGDRALADEIAAARDQRLGAAAPRVGGGDADARRVRADRAGVRLRAAGAGERDERRARPRLPAVRPARAAGVPARPLAVHARAGARRGRGARPRDARRRRPARRPGRLTVGRRRPAGAPQRTADAAVGRRNAARMFETASGSVQPGRPRMRCQSGWAPKRDHAAARAAASSKASM
jgi:hypothetical protein